MIDLARGSGVRPLVLATGAVAIGLVVAVALSTPWTPLDAGASPVPVDPDLDFSAAERAREEDYHAAVRPPAYLALGVGLLATVAIGFGPWGARLVRRLPSPRWAPMLVPALLGGSVVLLAVRLLTLPLAAWQESVRREYGLSTRDWGGWAADVARGLGLQAALTLVAVLAVVVLAARWPQRWWTVAAPGAAGLVVASSLLYPALVEPVFNTFEPLPDGELRTTLLDLADREGVDVGDVLVADASRRTSALNAYVSGLGPTKRVVLYDTLLETAPADEIEIVVAHELAHAREGDVLTGTLLGGGGAALAVLLVALAGSWRPLTTRAGVHPTTMAQGLPGASGRVSGSASTVEAATGSGTALGQAAAVPFVLAAVAVLGFVSGPGQALVSRHIEAQADVVALDLTEDADTFARMQRTLAVTALSDLDPPRPLYIWFASHPTAPQRIATARTWALANGLSLPPPMSPDR